MVTTHEVRAGSVRFSADAGAWDVVSTAAPVGAPGDSVEIELADHWQVVCDLLDGVEVPVDYLREAVIVLTAVLDELRGLAASASLAEDDGVALAEPFAFRLPTGRDR
ncbi:MAG: hypothetical protein ACRCYU_02885 [Nocardioides sp.]